MRVIRYLARSSPSRSRTDSRASSHSWVSMGSWSCMACSRTPGDLVSRPDDTAASWLRGLLLFIVYRGQSALVVLLQKSLTQQSSRKLCSSTTRVTAVPGQVLSAKGKHSRDARGWAGPLSVQEGFGRELLRDAPRMCASCLRPRAA